MKKRILCAALSLVFCLSLAIPSLAATDKQIGAADRLYSLNLFKGVGVNADGSPNFALDNTMTRQEAATMLVRLMGKESSAAMTSWGNTIFEDLTPLTHWAIPYVNYAYTTGITNGVSKDNFGAANTISASEYLSFVLRALGYEDDVDFSWDKAWELSNKLGITSGEYDSNPEFTRGDAALVSSKALDLPLKDSSDKLLDKATSKPIEQQVKINSDEYQVTFPEEWVDRVDITEMERYMDSDTYAVRFSSKVNADYGGHISTIWFSNLTTQDEIDDCPGRIPTILGQWEGGYILLDGPSDVQCDIESPERVKEYQLLAAYNQKVGESIVKIG